MSDDRSGPPPTRDLDPETREGSDRDPDSGQDERDDGRNLLDPERRRLLAAGGGVLVAGGVAVAGLLELLRTLAPPTSGSDHAAMPAAELSLSTEPGGVVITHIGGERITAADTGATGDCERSGLEISYVDRGGADATECWPTPIGEDDTVTVSAREGTVLKVLWRAPSAAEPEEMWSVTVP